MKRPTFLDPEQPSLSLATFLRHTCYYAKRPPSGPMFQTFPLSEER